jgi:NADPH:quinone reductase-like Zn-dependent oxidoreductase
MSNLVVQMKGFGGPEQIEIVDAPLPTAGPGEVRVRVLASSVQFTDTVIRRHRYPHVHGKPPLVLGYDVVGEIDQVGEGVRELAIGDRVADLTVIGSNAQYRTLRANRVTRLSRDVDPAEAATLVLSWTTAYQLLHRAARVREGQRVLVHGAAGAVGQAQLALGKLAGLEMWGTARTEDLDLVRELGATPIDRGREDFTRAVPGGFDVVFDGIAEEGYRRSWQAVKQGGLLCAYGFSAAVNRPRLTIAAVIARLYLWSLTSPRRRARFYSINAMRSRHPAWFRADLEYLLALLAAGAIHPRVAERITFGAVTDAHRRLEAMGLRGKIVLCPQESGASLGVGAAALVVQQAAVHRRGADAAVARVAATIGVEDAGAADGGARVGPQADAERARAGEEQQGSKEGDDLEVRSHGVLLA